MSFLLRFICIYVHCILIRCASKVVLVSKLLSPRIPRFTLHGPTVEDFTCPMTVACSIQLTGTGLANTNNVKVQGSGTPCSTGASTASGYTGMTLDKQVTNSGGFDVYALGTASAGVAGSTLVLCFAYSSNYVFEVGTSRRALSPTVLAVLFSTKIQVQQR